MTEKSNFRAPHVHRLAAMPPRYVFRDAWRPPNRSSPPQTSPSSTAASCLMSEREDTATLDSAWRTPMHNLLTDPIFRTQSRAGFENLTLPALLAELAADNVESLQGIRAHQRDGFHIFCCYLAGL